MLDSYREHSLSPSQQDIGRSTDHGLSPSTRRHNNSPGTDMESDSPSQASPQVPADQPVGVDSDDNFEVSDDADEQQVSLVYGALHALRDCHLVPVSTNRLLPSSKMAEMQLFLQVIG